MAGNLMLLGLFPPRERLRVRDAWIVIALLAIAGWSLILWGVL